MNKEERVSTWSLDAWGYGIGKAFLHQPHPWVLVVLLNGETLRILAGATRCCEIDFRKEPIFCFDTDLDLLAKKCTPDLISKTKSTSLSHNSSEKAPIDLSH